MATATLKIIGPKLAGQQFLLPARPVTIGRNPDNDLVIADRSVSRQHVRAEVKNGCCILTDLGSHNAILINGAQQTEAKLAPGQRFNLGEISFEFQLTEEPAALAVANPLPPQPPMERPVLVDEIFAAPHNTPEAAEEQAVAAGARGTLRYLLLIGAILLFGAIAWHFAGAGNRIDRVIAVDVMIGERKAIDLGFITKQIDKRITNYIDPKDIYDSDYMDPDGNKIATFELDKQSGFIATIEGLTPGTTNVHLSGPHSRRAIVKIIVSGEKPIVRRDILTQAQSIALAEQFIETGKTLRKNGQLYNAVQSFKDAQDLVQPVPPTLSIWTQANDLYNESQAELNKQFEDGKSAATLLYKKNDKDAALQALDRLDTLIPNHNDERRQRIDIIRRRLILEE